MTRKLNLNLFIYPGGHHEAAWRYPGSQPDQLAEIRYYQSLAQKAEAAKLDAIFFADGPALAENIRYASRFRLEPLTTLAAIAAVTDRIGLIATASTTYFEPYNLARLFASVDHISHGRVGWNIVTTSAANAAQNFGLEHHPVHEERYDRAHEFVDVVSKLWDSWEDDAVVADAASGVFVDDAKVHAIDHAGERFRVKGPLNLSRSPQGRPVYVQAGSSQDGRHFAALHAEAIFTAHQTLASAQEFYADIKARARGVGRNPDHIKVLPGISPFIAGTEAEAKALEEEFNNLTQPAFSLDQLKRLTGVDYAGHDLDAPFPVHLLRERAGDVAASRFKVVHDIVEREKPTLRGLLHRLAGARGHRVVAGTPEQIADTITEWFQNGAADGFNIMPPWLPGGIEVFTAEVLPILRARGLFREEYEGSTLRDHYGLPRPDSIYSRPAALRTA
ncbi:LLM class flavin-dependent oxidoreductase [Cereibacter sp. SYSU M97828]|nr:LLM class flavin-dependent oxidoreductase [Cereibacter flavus]